MVAAIHGGKRSLIYDYIIHDIQEASMFGVNSRVSVLCLAVLLGTAPAARAQWAVVDAPAIVQLIQEVQTMRQQLATARDQLQSAQQAFQAMTGNRGMAGLLAGTPRNYLPSNWSQVTGAMRGSGAAGYPGLTTDVQSAMTANAVLSPERLATLSVPDQRQILAARQWNAMQQALSHEALANASSRFAAIQSLIATISTATDQKASLDLQARISAELGMLQNEQTKFLVLSQATHAQESLLRQQTLEQAIVEHGRFETRFQATP
jgi:type IV secretion system protein VirB5